MQSSSVRCRATPMAPDDRRAAILAAAVPLLRERGANVSTRELAAAAGVAEGTLFRVFPDKRSLLRAAVAEAMDPEPLIVELEGIGRDQRLERRITRIVEILSVRMSGVMQLVMALHDLARDAEDGPQPHRHPPEREESRDTQVLAAIADVLSADAARLRVTPMQAAGILRGVVIGERLSGLTDDARVAPSTLAHCLVHGLVVPVTPRTPDPQDLTTSTELPCSPA